MGTMLTLKQRELIEDLVLKDAAMDNRYHSMEFSPLPFEKAVYNHPEHGFVQCQVISWELSDTGGAGTSCQGTATVAYYNGGCLKKRTCASLARITRFSPRWADRELDAEAVRIGCTQFFPPVEAAEI